MNPRMRLLGIFFGVTACMLMPWGAAAGDRDAPEGGEFLFSVETDNNGKLPIFRGAAVIDCPASEVWTLLNDYNGLKHIFPGIVESRLERAEGNVYYVYEEDHVPVLQNTRLHLRCVHDDRNWRKTVSLVEGSVRSLEACWELEPVDQNRTLVRYSLQSDPGYFIPVWLQKIALRKAIGGMFEGLRKTPCPRPTGMRDGNLSQGDTVRTGSEEGR